MPRFARETVVPVERSRAEIEETLRRYGAKSFTSGWCQDSAMIAFQLNELFIRFVLPIPKASERRFTHKKNRRGFEERRTENQQFREHEQEIRSRWRALLLVIKAKLEAVECEISTIEQEFMAHIVMPNDMTIGQWVIDQALPQIRQGAMPRLMLSAPKDTIQDAEFEEKK